MQADGVAKVVGLDHLEQKRLACRVFEALVQAEDERENVDVPELDCSGDGENAQDQCLHTHQRVQGNHQAPLVESIGNDPSIRGDEEHGHGLQRHHHADRGGGVGELEDEHDWAMVCIHLPAWEIA